MGIKVSVLPTYTGKYDVEQFLKDVETLFKAKLDAEIDIINTEKGDFTLPYIETDAWYLANIPKVWSFKQNIIWGPDVQDPTDVQEDNMKRTIKVFIEVIMSDDANSDANHVTWKLLRYTRALEAVAQKNFSELRGIAKLKVEALLPQTFAVFGKIHRSSGIRLTASLAAF